MLKVFIQQEKKFFETCYFLINNFFNGMGILEQSVPYQKSTYDPMKYIRANKIMEGVDSNSLPNIKMKEKYSFDTYKNAKSSQINYSNGNFNKKYSFDEYKLSGRRSKRPRALPRESTRSKRESPTRRRRSTACCRRPPTSSRSRIGSRERSKRSRKLANLKRRSITFRRPSVC